MAIIRVTKEFNIEMAHALKNYDGPCKNIHGHSYKLFVTVIGEPNAKPNHPKLGMLIDFGDLKSIVNTEIVEVFDHAFVINQNTGFNKGNSNHEMFENTIYVDYQPTCENMVIDFAKRIKLVLPAGVRLYSLKLYETATAYSEWFANDNS